MRRPSLSGEALVATALIVFLAILAWPMEARTASGDGATAASTAPTSPVGGKRYHRGFYEGFQIGLGPPSFWIYVDDDTADGMGVAYFLYHASYLEPGPANPSITNTLLFNAEAQATTLEEAKAWIVLNNAHVNDPFELLVHQHDVSIP